MLRVKVNQLFMASDWQDKGQRITVNVGEEFPMVSMMQFPSGGEHVVFTHEGRKYFASCASSPNPFWEIIDDDE